MRRLAIDAGNTQLSWGLFVDDELTSTGGISNDEEWSPSDEPWGGVDDVVVGSVRDVSIDRLVECWRGPHPPIRVLGRDLPIPVPTDVAKPEQVGTDRLLNALAWTVRDPRPAVVVDFGTAITLDVIGRGGVYRGGLILPGPGLIAAALDRGTALLPRVEIEPTPELFGRDTRSAVRRGVFGLLRGGVEFHLRELRECLDEDTAFVATGGGARSFASWFTGIDLVVPHLTLEGVQEAARRSSGDT